MVITLRSAADLCRSADERTFSFSLLSNDRRGQILSVSLGDLMRSSAIGFGAVQSGFGGVEPPRLPEMLPVWDARGPGRSPTGVQAARRPTCMRTHASFPLLRTRHFAFLL